MKHILPLAFVFSFATQVLSQQVPVYLYFASHNETTDQNFHNLNYSDPVDYAIMRGYIQQVCDTLRKYGAPYDMMLESNFLLGCLKNENATTNPNDLVEWVSQQPGFSVQPHNHFKPSGVGANPYNYTDLVHLLDSCGVDTAYVMGGFIWRNFTSPVMVNEDWTAWQTPQPGFTFPGFRWRPTLLWGGGSPNHIDDFNAYGVWKPQAASSTQFGVHDPSKTLVNFGGGCNDDFILWDTVNATMLAYRIMNFADSAQAHYAGEPDAFFNLKVMMNFRHFPSPGYAQKLGQVLRTIQPYLNNGKIKYSGILDTYKQWQFKHPSTTDYFALKCEESVTISNQKPLIFTNSTEASAFHFQISPNPVSDMLTFKEPIEHPIVYNSFGRVVFESQSTLSQLSVVAWPSGIYFLRGGSRIARIMVQH